MPEENDPMLDGAGRQAQRRLRAGPLRELRKRKRKSHSPLCAASLRHPALLKPQAAGPASGA
jgi:hypothetical protein